MSLQKELDRKLLGDFIESLKSDSDKWTLKHCAAIDWSWTEFHSPEYTSEDNTVQFAFTLVHTGAYVNGYFSWSVPFWISINPLSEFNFYKRRMKRIVSIKYENERLTDLQQKVKKL